MLHDATGQASVTFILTMNRNDAWSQTVDPRRGAAHRGDHSPQTKGPPTEAA